MVHMEPEDPREWEVTINRRKCPVVYYPANYVGCQMLPSGCRCSLDNCPLKKDESSDDNKAKIKPCDCPHEENGCHYSGHCKHRKAPNKDLNGTWLPTCGLKFPGKIGGE